MRHRWGVAALLVPGAAACFATLDGYQGGRVAPSGGEAGVGADGAPSDDGAIPPADGGASDGDAGSSDADSGVDSGARTTRCPRVPDGGCVAGEEVCCASGQSRPSDPEKNYACVGATTCASPAIRVLCDGPADCSSDEVCCLLRDTSATMLAVSCVAPQSCGAASVICDSASPICGLGELCLPDPNGYYKEITVCQPPP